MLPNELAQYILVDVCIVVYLFDTNLLIGEQCDSLDMIVLWHFEKITFFYEKASDSGNRI